MGGAYPLYYEPLPDCRPEEPRETLQLCIVGVSWDPVRPMRLMRPCETPEGNETATPLRLSIIFPTFLGELDSRLSEFCSRRLLHYNILDILGLDCIGIYYFISIIFHGVIQHVWCFFLEVPRIEELQDPNRSPGREEVGRRTLRDDGGFLLPFFYRDRFRLLTSRFS